MKGIDLKRVLKVHGLPELNHQVFVKNVLYELPIGLITSGVCFNRSSNPKDVRLEVIQQPLYFPDTSVTFWTSTRVDPERGQSWDFDPDPHSEASYKLVNAVKNLCMPLLKQRLSVEEVLAISCKKLAKFPSSMLEDFQMTCSLCMLGRLDDAWAALVPLADRTRRLMKMPKPSIEQMISDSDGRHWSYSFDLWIHIEPLERAFLSANRNEAVAQVMENFTEGTRQAIGLAGID